MKKLLLDTNVFLRFLLNDIPDQADEAELLFGNARKGICKLYVPQIVIFEIHYALLKYYSFPKKQILEKLTSIVSVESLEIQGRDVFILALRIYESRTISLVDSFLIAYAQLNEAKFFSFDKKLQS